MSSRAPFAQRLLRPVSSQPLRANLPLYLRWTCCIRRIHRYLGCSRSGFHRMDSGMARKIAGGLDQQAAFALALACLPSHLEPILARALRGVDVVILNRGVSGEMAED